MTRSRAEIENVLAQARLGRNQCEIARLTGIPRGTVGNWLRGQLPRHDAHGAPGQPCTGCPRPLELAEDGIRKYSYLLGLYLGDGSISTHPKGVFRLRIDLDRRYPGIVEECTRAMATVMPSSRLRVDRPAREEMDVVSAYSKHWPCFFPQHGPGRKHERRIRLAEWQREICDRHPWQLLRGLIHSDGSRFSNPAIHPHRTYRYPRYNFTNHSADIRAIFCEYCENVGVEWRQMNAYNISVAKRVSVALMDRYIGPKR